MEGGAPAEDSWRGVTGTAGRAARVVLLPLGRLVRVRAEDDTIENPRTDTSVLPAGDPVNPSAPCTGGAPGPAGLGIGTTLVLGGGYTGRRFAAALEAQGLETIVTHRSPLNDEGGGGSSPGRRWLHFDAASDPCPTAADLGGSISHVLVTIPPDREGRDPVLQRLSDLLEGLPLQWLGYLSTTGIYGDQGGNWVDESTPPAPRLPRSRARLACEQEWRRRDLPLQVFRLPAIYGPGRTPFPGLRSGQARLIHKPGQVFSRVHVDDIVGALLHCIAAGKRSMPDTVLVSDHSPCPSSETLGYAAHLLGCRLPPVQPWDQVEQAMSPMARSFWTENRRVSSRLLREGLGYRFRYPTYREGYRACLESLSSEN